MPKLQSGTIGCHCGKCEITVADNRAVQYFRCGCEDCRQGIEWGAVKSTVTPDQLPHGYYIPADIISIKGKENIQQLESQTYFKLPHRFSTTIRCHENERAKETLARVQNGREEAEMF